MSFSRRYPLNVPCKFYVDDQCTDCDLCRECAPNNIKRDEKYGHSYVYKQPESNEEVAAVMEGVDGCPTEAVRNDGDEYDWSTYPIMNWNAFLCDHNHKANFKLNVPIITKEEILEEDRIAMEKWRIENPQEDESKPWWRFWG